MKPTFNVESIDKTQYAEWLLKKHYAHRLPSISYAFGLFVDKELNGVCTFGCPPSNSLIIGTFKTDKWKVIELNRLCVNDELPPNTLSWFVSQCLNKLPKPIAVVSYADTSHNHNGYIYQATNFIYTGLSDKRTEYAVKGLENMHSKSICESVKNKRMDGQSILDALKKEYGEDRVYIKVRPRKHRYYYFVGNKWEKKQMMSELNYKIEAYPKGENKKYDASYQPNIQQMAI